MVIDQCYLLMTSLAGSLRLKLTGKHLAKLQYPGRQKGGLSVILVASSSGKLSGKNHPPWLRYLGGQFRTCTHTEVWAFQVTENETLPIDASACLPHKEMVDLV